MRGKALHFNPHRTGFGITPACAGKRKWLCSRTSRVKDHPRACGEKPVQRIREISGWGSPPRMRGKGTRPPFLRNGAGITPAYAGKRVAVRSDLGTIRDHPRVCGEKGVVDLCHVEVNGITPAYAGKRVRTGKEWMMTEDHPRVCGKKFHPASDRKLGRVRGTKRSSDPAPAAAPAGLAGSCPASPPWSYPPRITVSRPRP